MTIYTIYLGNYSKSEQNSAEQNWTQISLVTKTFISIFTIVIYFFGHFDLVSIIRNTFIGLLVVCADIEMAIW